VKAQVNCQVKIFVITQKTRCRYHNLSIKLELLELADYTKIIAPRPFSLLSIFLLAIIYVIIVFMSEIESSITADLVNHGLEDETGRLHKPVYDLVVSSVPILCVDVFPVNISTTEPSIGVIERATGPEKNKLALIGGRVLKHETIARAIGRHLFDAFESDEFSFYPGNDEGTPFYVAQYAHASTSEGLYDPTKHSIALNFLIEINEPEVVQNEASDFLWISKDQIPSTSSYNQHIVMMKAFEQLDRFS
jgi:ADP-ribose pyrophosphatase YjhB (NUDIX family)